MSETEMRVTPERALALANQIRGVTERIQLAAKGRPVRLVAVSKLKPANDILSLHTGPAQQVHFGENYAQELVQKAALLPRTIRWHFIGGLQSTHCKTLAKVPNLWCVSSTENEDFAVLREQRDLVAKELDMASEDELELSMGMSDDFEGAIAMGSGEVRVGSTIFGERPAKADAKIIA
ncbi:YggS family pyridoxal phosphate enzyme [Magnaporthiopsis poae ATCC 64411]|uniref:YggS family pyridoxal phosphate enzyme n=1 Tax=Magnaporthiopsis poae (strain ATCC 64411 / 73-15) TaxID=644358 RepID=A0A0C4E7P1_MAGP6|nr:YggS family pyridoxal phosphate enzyme [Magnaporthiopsis poae ATCC 64411]